MYRKTVSIIALSLLFIFSTAIADYLEVRRAAPLRVAASTDSPRVEDLTVGMRLILLDDQQHQGYYRARDPISGESGYVYRTFVRRYPGDPGSVTASDSQGTTLPGTGPNILKQYEGEHSFAGFPADTKNQNLEILENIGYVVGYSENLKVPMWAAYKCSWVADAASPGKRPTRFKVDKRTQSKVSHDDYTQSDYFTNNKAYDRGHMAPNFAIGSRYGREAQLETFLMSNICPQQKTLNQQTWEAFEKQIARVFSADDEEVWVTVGPIFKGAKKRLNDVAAIPNSFYAIVVDDNSNNLRALAIIMDQKVSGIQPLEPYVVTIDSIESLTGFDFLHDLPDGLENTIESGIPDENWRLQELLVPSIGGD